MKLASLTIDNFRQFKDFRLDFTDPTTGNPLEKVCFIGPNGTGKSTLLVLLTGCCFGIRGWRESGLFQDWRAKPASTSCSVQVHDEGHLELLFPHGHRDPRDPEELSEFLTVYCPSEGEGGRKVSDLDPVSASLNSALALLAKVQSKHVVGSESAQQFWLWVVAHIKNREKQYLDYQRLPGNLNRTLLEINADFDRTHPQVLDGLSEVWDKILGISDLEFDRESVEIPVQLNEGLKAYIRTRAGKGRVEYAALSTGIRHYLFRLGHIWSLYFNRPPGDSVLLVDEPEGSLYPDFLYDIVGNYRDVAPGCQLFMGTHSPIVASQFKPHERFIFRFGEDGFVTARRGISPEGDDPNDILRQDFGIDSLMTEVGERAWQRFLSLRHLIPKSSEPERSRLIEEYSRLGSAYHFSPPGSRKTNGADS